MAFREIRRTPPSGIESLFEEASSCEPLIRRPAPTEPVVRNPEYVPQKRIIGTYSEDSIPLENFPLAPKKWYKPRLPELDKTVLKSVAILGVKFILGIILVYLGLTTTGSYFGPASGKFGKDLAVWFYQYQIGTFLAMIGSILIYDGLRHR